MFFNPGRRLVCNWNNLINSNYCLKLSLWNPECASLPSILRPLNYLEGVSVVEIDFVIVEPVRNRVTRIIELGRLLVWGWCFLFVFFFFFMKPSLAKWKKKNISSPILWLFSSLNPVKRCYVISGWSANSYDWFELNRHTSL
jgi:hypothetical protein